MNQSATATDEQIEAERSSPQRLKALRETCLLDTVPEESFDRLTRLACRLLNAPVAFFSLVDAERDFYKSHCGFGEPLASARELRGRTFCHHSLLSSGPLVLNDTAIDSVAREIPTCTSLGVRAYLGIPLELDNGQVIGSFCAIDFRPRAWSERDVDVLRELGHAALQEIRLRRALRMAQRNEELAQGALRSREQILAVVAHDLRAPIHAVQASANLLIGEDGVAEARDAPVRTILLAAQKMDTMVQELLELPTQETDAQGLHPVWVDPGQLLDDVSSLFASIARRSGVALRCDGVGTLPSLFIDYERVLRALANLVGNAIKFSPRGGVVRVHASMDASQIRFSVEDQGPGLAEHEVARAFEPRWQADPKDGRGAGLGLSIVKQIAEQHEGRLEVESTVGSGSTFSCVLPIQPSGRDHPERGALPGELMAAGAEPGALRSRVSAVGNAPPKRTILIVDDDQLVRRLARRILSHAGYECLEATTGDEAVETFTQHHERLLAVLLDFHLPGLRGDEVLARVREVEPLLPVIISSGAAASLPLDIPGVMHLPKPYLARDLLLIMKGGAR